MTRVAVLLGGPSSEREVSLSSGRECAKALRAGGYEVVEIDPGPRLLAQLHEAEPDVVFNALHGPWGEDGRVQGLLEWFTRPYTHSGVLASALAMDKQRAKAVFEHEGLDCPRGVILNRHEIGDAHPMTAPYVIKPVNEGSSVGVYIIRDGDNRPPAALGTDEWTLGDELLVEEFIPGRELTVAVLGDEPLAVTEIKPKTAFYDYEAKYTPGGSSHEFPAQIPASVERRAMEAALTAHNAVGAKGLTRADFRWDDEKDRLALLEINTQPGMTPTSLAPEQAAYRGRDFRALCAWIVEDASCPR